MILDAADKVMASYAPTTSGATLQSYVDRLAKMADGAGGTIGAVIQVAAAATSTGTATVTFDVIGNATDVTFASGNVVLATSGAVAVATLTAGYLIQLKYSRQGYDDSQPNTSFVRYETIRVTIATPGLTAGTFNGWLTNEGFQDNLSYPAGYTVAG